MRPMRSRAQVACQYLAGAASVAQPTLPRVDTGISVRERYEDVLGPVSPSEKIPGRPSGPTRVRMSGPVVRRRPSPHLAPTPPRAQPTTMEAAAVSRFAGVAVVWACFHFPPASELRSHALWGRHMHLGFCGPRGGGRPAGERQDAVPHTSPPPPYAPCLDTSCSHVLRGKTFHCTYHVDCYSMRRLTTLTFCLKRNI